jgi:hypothetical protein
LYAGTMANVNIQLSVVEGNFCRTTSVIPREVSVYELLYVLPLSTGVGDEAVDHASFALDSSRAIGSVRARGVYA